MKRATRQEQKQRGALSRQTSYDKKLDSDYPQQKKAGTLDNWLGTLSQTQQQRLAKKFGTES